MSFKERFIKYWKKIQVYSLYIIGVILVFMMYPREGKFKYEYTKNAPWRYQDLIAPFDFPIYKDDDQIARETDSITQRSLPYFVLDTTVLERVMESVEDDSSEKQNFLSALPMDLNFRREVQDTLPGLLRYIYGTGIIEMNPVIQKNNDQVEIIVMRRQIAKETLLSDIYTEKRAYEYVMNALRSYTNRTDEQILSRYTIADYIRPNILYDESMTQNVLRTKLASISNTQGMVQEGQIIISRGEIVTPERFRIVESLRKEYETNSNVSRNYSLIYFGQFILISLLFLALLWYVSNFRKDMMGSGAQTLYILSLILLMVALTKVTVDNEAISYYVIPFAIVPIFLKTFFNVRFALFVHFLILLMAGFWIPNTYQFLLMNFLAGVVAVFSMSSYYRMSILFYIALFVSLT